MAAVSRSLFVILCFFRGSQKEFFGPFVVAGLEIMIFHIKETAKTLAKKTIAVQVSQVLHTNRVFSDIALETRCWLADIESDPSTIVPS